MKYVSGLAAVIIYFFLFKKPHSFQGAAHKHPQFFTSFDLGFGLQILHCRPRVRVRIKVRVTIRVRDRYDQILNINCTRPRA